MRIIRHGIKAVTYRKICPSCSCLFEFKSTEARFTNDRLLEGKVDGEDCNGRCLLIECPDCGRTCHKPLPFKDGSHD